MPNNPPALNPGMDPIEKEEEVVEEEDEEVEEDPLAPPLTRLRRTGAGAPLPVSPF